MIVMTPTLSDYFEDWKESRYAPEKSGRFQAVSRVSDMRGIMGSCQVMQEGRGTPSLVEARTAEIEGLTEEDVERR